MMAIANNDLLRLITAERDKLNNMIEQLQAGYDLRPAETVEIRLDPPSYTKTRKYTRRTPTGQKKRSAEARQHMREAQLRRYRKLRSGNAATSVRSSTYKTGPGFREGKHWTQTPEGRRRMAAIAARAK